MKLLVPFGTRPEIIKLAPVVHALRAAGHAVATLASGQQSDPAMSADVAATVGLVPDRMLSLPSDPAELLGALVTAAWREIERVAPDAVIVQGDTSTVLAFAIGARRCGVPVVHLEAGLRSWNERSSEELHRRLVAKAATLHLAPTERARRALLAEGVGDDRIHVVGNSALDAVRLLGVARPPIADRDGVLLTAHRAGTVDDPARLAALVDIATALMGVTGRVRFPVHPRTRARLDAAGHVDRLRSSGVELLEPLPWPDMVAAVAASRVAVTDSGGLQEEAAWYGVPAVVLRRSTPRWEGVEAGIAVLTGVDVSRAVEAATRLVTPAEQERVADVPCPYGDGHTAERVATLLDDPRVWSAMTLREPDLRDGPPC